MMSKNSFHTSTSSQTGAMVSSSSQTGAIFSLFATLLMSALIACSPEKRPELEAHNGVIIINQGNFSEQNGSISYYSEITGDLQNLAFEAANGFSLGSIVLSGWVDEQNIAYLICSNPAKIVRLEAPTAKIAAPSIVEGLANPRNLITHNGIIYVTNWGRDESSIDLGNWFYEYPDSYVALYNQSTGAFIKEIYVGSDCEGLCVVNNQLFVAVKEGVKVIDLTTGNLKTTIVSHTFYGAAKHLVVDYQNHVWASYPGEGVMEIDVNYAAQARTIDVPLDYEGYITINQTRDQILTFTTLYDENWQSIGSTIYAADIRSGTYRSLLQGEQFYSVGANPYTGTLYASEVNGFATNSTLMVFNSDGVVTNSKVAGVATARYLFY